jgi:hypothetical protein
MPDAPEKDWDDQFDPQDEAEVFDETHGLDEDPTGADPDNVDGDPDELTDVYDVTSALGDADDDEDDDVADDYDDDDLEDLDLDDEEDVDQDEDDDLDDDLEDAPEADARAGLDRLIDRTTERAAPIEPSLSYVDDLDAVTNPRDDDVEKYESTRALSDEQLADLGYLPDLKQQEVQVVKDEDKTKSTKPEANRAWEDHSFEAGVELSILQGGVPEPIGSGASADDVEDEADPDEQNRLDEGLEETFPASDPVSAKHIT